jgi:hypothetical protein
MPNAQLTNPKGAGYFDAAIEGGYTLDFEIDTTVSGNSPIGTLVELLTPFTGPGTTNPPAVPTVKPSSTTADGLCIGVIAGGQSPNSNSGGAVPPGKIANVKVLGIAQVLCDATTTAGQFLIQSAATAGCAKTTGSAVTNGQGIGVCLQSVTISSGTALVWALICKF